MAVPLESLFAYASMLVTAALVLATGYGFLVARVRYYRVGMMLLFLGFLLSVLAGAGETFVTVRPVQISLLEAVGRFFLLVGLVVLTFYRRRLGL